MPAAKPKRPERKDPNEIVDGETIYRRISDDEFLVYHAQHVCAMDSLGCVRKEKLDFLKVDGWSGDPLRGEGWLAMHKGRCYGIGATREIAVAILVEASKRDLLPL